MFVCVCPSPIKSGHIRPTSLSIQAKFTICVASSTLMGLDLQCFSRNPEKTKSCTKVDKEVSTSEDFSTRSTSETTYPRQAQEPTYRDWIKFLLPLHVIVLKKHYTPSTYLPTGCQYLMARVNTAHRRDLYTR